MNSALLLEYFDRISDAPDAVSRLRRFILDLAVRGKLVGQDSDDEPASILLKRIETEKTRLVKEGKIRNQDQTQPVEKEEQPFDLPASWVWARFGGIADFSAGRTPSRHDFSFWNTGDHFWVSIADMKDGGEVTSTKETISEKAKSQVFGSEPAPIGTLIMSFKLTIGKISKLAVPAFHNEAIISVRPHEPEMDRFLFKMLPQFSRQGDTKNAVKGATLNRDSIAKILLPLPPLSEQHRIIAKVDELMALCDRLEDMQRERETRRNRLTAASLHRLQNGANPEDFRKDVHFYLNHLPRFTARPEQVQQFRRTVLSLAVRGQLVSPEPSDEPATALLQRIQAEKARQIKDGILRKEKPLPPLTDHEKPFPVPSAWMWARVGAMSLLTDYGTSVKSNLAETGVPVLSMGDIQGGLVILGAQKKVPHEIEDLPRLLLKRLDLLYNRTNSAELVGKTGIYMGDDDAYTFASYLIRIRFLSDLASPVYANLAMNAPYFRATQIVPGLQQQCGQANVNGTKLRNMLIPVPPLEEQHRIVAKVAELMSLCDQLEGQLSDSEDHSRRLLEAALHSALATVGTPPPDFGRLESSCPSAPLKATLFT